MKQTILILALIIGLIPLIGTACSDVNNQDILFQTAPFIALQQGDFDGTYKCGDLKKHGDYGLGTVDDLNGEMIMVDGIIYQIRSNGVAYVVPDSMETPYSAVTFFQDDKSVNIEEADSFAQLQQLIDKNLPTYNTFYAIRIKGTFDYIKARSVPPQSEPFPTLAEAAKEQTIFEFNNVPGVIFGLRCPPYIGDLNVAGYHFHFITADRKAGGHIFECSMHNVIAEIDETNTFELAVPTTATFSDMSFIEQPNPERDQAEK
jgi:acetolactate decarboxylase